MNYIKISLVFLLVCLAGGSRLFAADMDFPLPDKQESPAVEGPKTPQVQNIPSAPTAAGVSEQKITAPSSAMQVSIKVRQQRDESMEDYMLQPGDRIKITIYPDDEYIKGSEMVISTDGNITLPLIGKVEIGKKSLVEAEKTILKVIDGDYLINPEVVIEVLKQTQEAVVLLGAVKQPGPYEYPIGARKFTLLQAIAKAGGFSDVANIKKIKVVRQKDGEKKVIHANAEAIISGSDPDVDLEAGDVVSVAESLF